MSGHLITPFFDPIPGIPLFTRRKGEVDNFQAEKVSLVDKKGAEDLAAKYSDVDVRAGGLIPHYNCHGLTFASRRTGISDSAALRQILEEDGYEEVKIENVLPGDVILYFDPETGDFEHSGIVVSRENSEIQQTFRVVSKWGMGLECVHGSAYCPYSFQTAKYYRIVK
ncbi:hypothetical protein [Chthoniobacter flavus]|nr:hypothetical protein [Chthoniobacter flavus]